MWLRYPGPRGFSWFFSAWDERATKQRSIDITILQVAKLAVRKKNLWLLWTWISLSCRRQLSNASNLWLQKGPMVSQQVHAYQPLIFLRGADPGNCSYNGGEEHVTSLRTSAWEAISSITCLKRHGNAEQNIENLAVCCILNGYMLFVSVFHWI